MINVLMYKQYKFNMISQIQVQIFTNLDTDTNHCSLSKETQA